MTLNHWIYVEMRSNLHFLSCYFWSACFTTEIRCSWIATTNKKSLRSLRPYRSLGFSNVLVMVYGNSQIKKWARKRYKTIELSNRIAVGLYMFYLDTWKWPLFHIPRRVEVFLIRLETNSLLLSIWYAPRFAINNGSFSLTMIFTMVLKYKILKPVWRT